MDRERTYAADYDMKGDPRRLAEKGSRDTQRLEKDGKAVDSKDRAAVDGLVATAGQTGQT